MLMNYLNIGIASLIASMPTAIIFLIVYYVINYLIGKKIKITVFNTICQVAWIAIVISILGITGILGSDYNITSILDWNFHYSFNVFEQGITIATVLNLILFIPYGFLSTVIFKKIRKKKIYGVLIGFIFTVGIEFLQCFTGRFVEIEDILMNTLGTYIGYSLCIILLKYINKNLKKCSIECN